MALTSLSNLKQYLNVTTSDEDAFLTLLLAGVEAEFLSLVMRNIEQASYTEYLDGPGGVEPVCLYLSLTNYPVRATPAPVVYEDPDGNWGSPSGSFPAPALTSGTDYALVLDSADGSYSESGRLYRINRAWPYLYRRRGWTLGTTPDGVQGCVKVTYTAGYPTVPADIQDAIYQTCAWRRKMRIGMFQTAQSYDGGSKSFELYKPPYPSMLMLGEAATVVARYKRVVF